MPVSPAELEYAYALRGPDQQNYVALLQRR